MKNFNTLVIAQSATNKQVRKRAILFSLMVFLSSLALFKSQNVVPSPANSANAEIGKAQAYSFLVGNLPYGATVTNWQFSSDIDLCLYSGIKGYIGLPGQSSATVDTSFSISGISAAWGDCCNASKTATLKATVYYTLNGSQYNASGSQSINLYRIPCDIPISGQSTLSNCCTSSVSYSAGDTGDANQFEWSITGGNAQIVSGGNTKNVVVNPATGNFTLTFKAWRSSNTAYLRTINKTITRSDLTASLSIPLYNGNTQTFICKNSGMKANLAINAGNCTGGNITWNAPDCDITNLGNGTYNIVPHSNLALGTMVNVSATVQFGSCTVTTNNYTLKVVDSQAPTVPNGYISLEYSGDFCTADIYNVVFNDYNFTNGISTITPNFMFGLGDSIHYNPSRLLKFTVCNVNLCTGLKSCKDFYINPPAPCSERISASALFSIVPNPASTETTIENSSSEDGTFYVFNSNGQLRMSGQLKAKQKVKINTNAFQEGQYIINLKTQNNNISKQLIINKK